MPKFVDHEERKIKIAEATWKLIVEQGIEQATVRKIAQESGLSVGALRHYFTTQSELLKFSMELVVQRVMDRTHSTNYKGSPFEIAMDAISEVLPIDSDRRVEMEVWFVFSAKTLVDQSLRSVGEKTYQNMHQGLYRVLEFLYSQHLLKKDIDLEMETNRLHPLVDGMASHHLLYPSIYTYEKMIATLRYHLKTLWNGDDLNESTSS